MLKIGFAHMDRLLGFFFSCIISHSMGICQSSLGSAQRKYSAFGVRILWRLELWKLSSLPFVSLLSTCTHLKGPTENWDTLTSTWDMKCRTRNSKMTLWQKHELCLISTAVMSSPIFIKLCCLLSLVNSTVGATCHEQVHIASFLHSSVTKIASLITALSLIILEHANGKTAHVLWHLHRFTLSAIATSSQSHEHHQAVNLYASFTRMLSVSIIVVICSTSKLKQKQKKPFTGAFPPKQPALRTSTKIQSLPESLKCAIMSYDSLHWRFHSLAICENKCNLYIIFNESLSVLSLICQKV